ncbi:MAG: zf-HC2 domain-containing protein, partial [Deltaproteobacteria bacterium]|nr:zf-HC2 domain-containing protein [Deltaproteobacteria bacterium]
MTGCNEHKILIQKFLDREISTGERERLEQHLSICRNCTGEFVAIQSGLDMLISMDVPEPGTDFTLDTVKKAFKAKKQLARRRRIASWGLSVLIGIISLIMIAGWTLVIQPVIQRVLLSAVHVLAQCSVLLTA